jgi:hypothetical protein
MTKQLRKNYFDRLDPITLRLKLTKIRYFHSSCYPHSGNLAVSGKSVSVFQIAVPNKFVDILHRILANRLERAKNHYFPIGGLLFKI